MFNTIRMELYRMWKTRSLYILWIVMAVLILFTTNLNASDWKSYTEAEQQENYEFTQEARPWGPPPWPSPSPSSCSPLRCATGSATGSSSKWNKVRSVLKKRLRPVRPSCLRPRGAGGFSALLPELSLCYASVARAFWAFHPKERNQGGDHHGQEKQ